MNHNSSLRGFHVFFDLQNSLLDHKLLGGLGLFLVSYLLHLENYGSFKIADMQKGGGWK